MEMDCILKSLASIFQSFRNHLLRQNQKCSKDYSSCKKLIDVLLLISKAMSSAPSSKGSKEGFLVLAGKQKKCFDRAPLLSVGLLVNSDLQIGVRGGLRVRVISSEQAHFEKFRPLNLKRVPSKENSYS